MNDFGDELSRMKGRFGRRTRGMLPNDRMERLGSAEIVGLHNMELR